MMIKTHHALKETRHIQNLIQTHYALKETAHAMIYSRKSPECLRAKLRICPVITLVAGVSYTLTKIFHDLSKLLKNSHLCHLHPPLTILILLLVSRQPVHPGGKTSKMIHLVLQPPIPVVVS